jgi:Ca-activated chloride channel homolog
MLIPDTFHFLRPLWFLALLPLPWLLWRFHQRSGHGRAWNTICDAHLLSHLLVSGNGRRHTARLFLFALTWLLAVLALAGPTWEKLPQPVYQRAQAQILILDLSPSMDATDLAPSRLTHAKYKLSDILARSREGQNALLVFAGDVHVVAPLTSDSNTIAALVPALQTDLMPVPGSQPGAALQRAADLLAQGHSGAGQVILITDSNEDAAALAQARQLRAQGHRLHVLSVGTTTGAPIPLADGGYAKDRNGAIVMPQLDHAALRALAQAGGGIYAEWRADSADIDAVLADKPPLDRIEQARETSDVWREQGPWLLLALLPLAALSFRRGWLFLFALLLIPPPLSAFNWQELWARPDQRGATAFADGHHAEAAELFQHPAWQGAAHYRAGNYAKAAEAFAQLDSAQSDYNRGNALAKAGELEAALQAYQQALHKDPNLEDAKANFDLVKTLLEQQENQPEQQQTGQENAPEQENQENDQSQEGQEAQENGQGQDSEENQESGQQNTQQQADQKSGQKDLKDTAGQEDQEKQENGQADRANRQDQEDLEDSQENGAIQAGEEQSEEQAMPGNIGVDDEAEASERDLALEQWLRRVPDDPGGLLRNKFYLEHQRRRDKTPTNAEQSW